MLDFDGCQPICQILYFGSQVLYLVFVVLRLLIICQRQLLNLLDLVLFQCTSIYDFMFNDNKSGFSNQIHNLWASCWWISAFYVTNPVYGILMGMIAGIVQVLVMDLVQKKWAREKDIFHTRNVRWGIGSYLTCSVKRRSNQ